MNEPTLTEAQVGTEHGQAVRWDLSDLFSGIDDPRIAETLDLVQARAERFQREYKGKIDPPSVRTLTADLLLSAIQELEAIDLAAAKPGAFAALHFSADTGDAARGAFLQRMREKATELSLLTLFFGLELAAVPDDIMEPLLASDLLSPYVHYIRRVRLRRDHVLSEPEERILEETANTGLRSWTRLFDELTSNAVFNLDGQELTQSQVLTRLYAADRETRRAAAASFSTGLKASVRPTTFIFNTLLADKNIRDRLRNYDYAEQSRHMSNELPRETVDLVVDTVVSHYGIVSRYYDTKRQILGLDRLTHYDRYAPLFPFGHDMEFGAARDLVLDAFGEFSPVVRDAAQEFFDKGWIDAAPVKGKQGGAYCSYITPDLHPYVFMSYHGKMKDVMTLAHELGHGVHASLSRGQSYYNFHGTLPLAELASTFGECLVFDKVTSAAPLQDKLALYADKIEGAIATISRQSAMYRFEQAIHRHRREIGELRTEDFCDYWQSEVQAMFGDSVILEDEHRYWWSYIPHFIRTPFYVYAYSFGELLALSLYSRSRSEGPGFADRYIGMLQAGGSVTPQELIAKVGVDLNDPLFWRGGVAVLEGLVTRFEELWEEYREKGGA